MCISNSGLSDKTKVQTQNKGQCKTEKYVSRNPLLLIHETVRLCKNHSVYFYIFQKIRILVK